VRGVYINIGLCDAIINLKPVQRSEDGCDTKKIRSFHISACKTVLNLPEAIYLRLRKIAVDRVTVVKFRVHNRGSDGAGCFRNQVRTNIAELSDMRIAGLLESDEI